MADLGGFALHPEAYFDIDEIRAYIAADDPDAADRFVDEIFESISSLVRFPSSGYLRPTLTTRPLRFRPVGEYVVVYAPHQKPLWVVAVIHGRRSPRVLAAILRDRE